MVAIGKKEEMAKVDTKKPTISDANTDSGTDSDSDGSDPPELEDNAGSALPGAHGDDKEGVSNTDILTQQWMPIQNITVIWNVKFYVNLK